MLQNSFKNVTQKPRVFIFGDPDSLGLSLIDYLLTNYCEVLVITSKLEFWREKTKMLGENKLFNVLSVDQEIKQYDLSYLIFIDTCINRSQKEIEKLYKMNKTVFGKKFIILPYQVSSQEEKKTLLETKKVFQEKMGDCEYFYVGDILGPNINENSYIYRILFHLINGIKIQNNSGVFPLLARDVAKELVRNLFSFGPILNEISFLGPIISTSDFLDIVSKIDSDYVETNTMRCADRIIVGNHERTVFETNLNYSIKETTNWLKGQPRTKEVGRKQIKKEKKKNVNTFKLPKINLGIKIAKPFKNRISTLKPRKFKTSSFFYLIFSLLVILFAPFLFLGVSALSFVGSVKYVEKGQIRHAVILSDVCDKTVTLTSTYFNTMSKVPVLGKSYVAFGSLAELIKQGNKMIDRVIIIYGVLDDFPQKVFGNELYSVSAISDELALQLDALSKEMSFFVAEIDALNELDKQLVYKYFPLKESKELRSILNFSKGISEHLDELLGSERIQTYLVLFQNNMELRPTGGFIGSFALLTFDSGRSTDINIQDVYSADGQLKGHVEPPVAIKNYLGEAGWYLRDANWSPDFLDSAQKIEWFLDKEIDQKVDGVIAIDLEVVKQLLRETGPITLNDYGKTVNYENVYEVTQSEVENDFFPGSTKKSSFLTALSKELITRLTSDSKINNVSLAKVFYKGLEEKHIQLYFHNSLVQKHITEIGYDGGVSVESCTGNCFYDFVSYADANVGVNKANYFINRSADLNIFFDGERVTNVLRITIKNNANPLLGEKGKYKSYFRAISLPGSRFNDSKIFEYGQESIKVPDIENFSNFKTAGISFSVGPSEEKTIEFSWTNELLNNVSLLDSGEFGVYFRKQSGTQEDKLNINLYIPNYLRVATNSDFTLTNQGGYVYNTLLTRDLFPHIYWR